MTASPVELHQPVMVFSGYGRSRYARPGTVAKIGRTWVTVEVEGRSPPRRFRLDDQTDGSGYSSGESFMTLDQHAAHQRQSEALAFLREQGVTLDFESPWRTRTVELADIIRAAITPTTPED
jgi:hypothetical protein